MILASRFLRLRWRQKGVFGLAYNVLFTRHLLVSRSAAADDDWLQDSSFGSFSVRPRWLVCALSARPITTTMPSPARGRRGVFAIISRRRTHWRSLDSMMIKRNIYCLMLMAFLNLFCSNTHTTEYGINFHSFSNSQFIFPGWRWIQKPAHRRSVALRLFRRSWWSRTKYR